MLHVRFCGDVSRNTCMQLVDVVSTRVAERASLVSQMRMASDADLPALPIHLHVTSNGGNLASALYAYDVLSKIPALHTHVEGFVASAASLLTLCGTHRTMTRHSMMLVHQPSVYVQGDWKFADVRDDFVNMQKYTQALLEIYNETTTMPYSALVALVQNEQMLTAAECLEFGFVDELV